MSFSFQDIDFNKAIKEDKHFVRKNILENKKDSQNVKKVFQFNKLKKGESGLILTSRLQIPMTGEKFVDEDQTAEIYEEIDFEKIYQKFEKNEN